MVSAILHNFESAATDCNVDINLSEGAKPSKLLLRSKYIQIEGDSNQAFQDL